MRNGWKPTALVEPALLLAQHITHVIYGVKSPFSLH